LRTHVHTHHLPALFTRCHAHCAHAIPFLTTPASWFTWFPHIFTILHFLHLCVHTRTFAMHCSACCHMHHCMCAHTTFTWTSRIVSRTTFLRCAWDLFAHTVILVCTHTPHTPALPTHTPTFGFWFTPATLGYIFHSLPRTHGPHIWTGLDLHTLYTPLVPTHIPFYYTALQPRCYTSLLDLFTFYDMVLLFHCLTYTCTHLYFSGSFSGLYLLAFLHLFSPPILPMPFSGSFTTHSSIWLHTGSPEPSTMGPALPLHTMPHHIHLVGSVHCLLPIPTTLWLYLDLPLDLPTIPCSSTFPCHSSELPARTTFLPRFWLLPTYRYAPHFSLWCMAYCSTAVTPTAPLFFAGTPPARFWLLHRHRTARALPYTARTPLRSYHFHGYMVLLVTIAHAGLFCILFAAPFFAFSRCVLYHLPPVPTTLHHILFPTHTLHTPPTLARDTHTTCGHIHC